MTPFSLFLNTHRTVKSYQTVGSVSGSLHCGTDAITVIAFNSVLMALCSGKRLDFLRMTTPKIVILMIYERQMSGTGLMVKR